MNPFTQFDVQSVNISYARIFVGVPSTAYASILIVYGYRHIRNVLPESVGRGQEMARRTRWYCTHRMPARTPLKPAPMTATFIGLYSSMLQSPSVKDDSRSEVSPFGTVLSIPKTSGSAWGSVTERTWGTPVDMSRWVSGSTSWAIRKGVCSQYKIYCV